MKRVIATTLILLSFFMVHGQRIKEITHREVHVHFNDSSVKANVLLADKKPNLRNSSFYYWYYNNAIKRNQGDYNGKLLDGAYHVVSGKGDLITKGKFKKGNKTGTWKNWNRRGELTSITHWKKGHRNGRIQKYVNGSLIEQGSYKKNKLNGSYKVFKNGKLSESRNYKNGVLHGKQIVYETDTVQSKEKYKNGELVVPKEKVKKTDEKSEKEKSVDRKWWKIWNKNKDKEESVKEDQKEEPKKVKKEKSPSSKKRRKKVKPKEQKDD